MQAGGVLVLYAGGAGNSGDQLIGRHIAAQVFAIFTEYRGGAVDAQVLRHGVLIGDRRPAGHDLL